MKKIMWIFIFLLSASLVLAEADAIVTINKTTLEPRTQINFQWTVSTDPDGDPVTYDLILSNVSDFSVILISKTGLNTNSYLPAYNESLSNGIYYLKVSACDPFECNAGDSVSFTINVVVPEEIKLLAVKGKPYLSGFLSYLTDDPFKSRLQIMIKISDKKIAELNKNITADLKDPSTFEDLVFTYDSNKSSRTIPFDKYQNGYLFEGTVQMKGNEYLYPFDAYATEIYVFPPRLKKTISEEVYNSEFNLISDFENNKITIIKKRNFFPTFIRYLIGFSLFLIYFFNFRKHSLQINTKFTQNKNFLTQFSIFLAVLSTSFFFSLAGLKYFISIGAVPFILLIMSVIFYHVKNVRRNF